MARYDTLPIYKAVYDFLLRIMRVISHFPREYKYTLGERIQNTAISMIVAIYRANTSKDKVPYLKELNEHIQMMYLYLRISHDIKLLPTERFASIVEAIDDVSNQAQGWLKTNEKVREPAVSTD